MKRQILLLAVCLLGTAAFAQKPKDAVHEYIEWTDDWVAGANKTDKPHILMIGNSITRGCFPIVEKAFDGRAYVSRICNSKCIGDPALWDDLKLVLKYYKFDVIQFNNGLHGFDYSEETYSKYFRKYLRLIKKYQPQAKLIWATITPTWQKDFSGPSDIIERIKARNRIAMEYISKEGIEVNDLWTTAYAHPEYFKGGDGTHPNKTGWEALGAQTVSVLEKYLPEK